jgi:cytidylate kinase
MEKKRIITLAGNLGSGKSSTAKRLADILNYEHYSTGDFMRAIADEKGISLIELSSLAESDRSIDEELDNKNKEVGKKENVVIDSRLGFYFIPHSFKVFLKLDPEISAERILKDKQTNPNRQNEANQDFDTKEGIMRNIKIRQESERKRYQEMYGISDYTDSSNFDLIIDTSLLPLEGVVDKIIEEYNYWLRG